MIRVFFFGTAGARSYADRDNTYLGFECDGDCFFIDCGGAPTQRSLVLSFPWLNAQGVILTHLHPDHYYGLPSLIHNLRLYNRTSRFPVLTHSDDVKTVTELLSVFRFGPMYKVPIEVVPIDVTNPVEVTWGTMHLRLFATEHGIPSMGVRVHDSSNAIKVVYSSDTRPSELTIKEAQGAHLLIHEASFLETDRELALATNHSTAAEAGRVAAAAGVKALCLVHCYSEGREGLSAFAEEAATAFSGPITIPSDLSIVNVA